MTPLKITAKPQDAVKVFVQEQIEIHSLLLTDGRYTISEQAFRAALEVAYYMGAVSALKTAVAA